MSSRPPVPVLLEAGDGTLNLDEFSGPLTVEVGPYEQMMSGDQIHLHVGDQYINTATVSRDDIGGTLRFKLPLGALPRNRPKVTLNYRLDRADGTVSVSTPLEFSTKS